MDDQQFKQLLEALKDALSRMGLTDGLGDLADNVDDANKNLTKQERLYKATASAFDKLNKDIDKGRKKIVDLGPALKNLGEQIEDLDDDVEKLALEEKHKLLAEQYLTAQYKKAGQDMSKVFGASLAKGVFDSTKTLVKSLQSGGSGVQLAADLMSTALDLNQSVLTGTAKTGEALGQSMMAAGGKTAKWGGRLAVASTAVDYFSSALTAAVKEGVQLLAAEADKTIKAFNTATSAGALFAHGMDDMRFYASRANLTLDQFSNVIKNNSGLLAEAGYTVGDGAKIVGNITSRFAVQTGKSGQTLQREMLNLGYGFEEQANAAAQLASDLRKTGGTATNGQMAAATVEMAKNTRAMADIMGEEFKARQESAKKAMEQYAFQTKINELARSTNDPGLIKRTEQALGAMSESQRRLAMQNYVLEGAMTDVPGLLVDGGEAATTFANNLRAGRTSIEDLTEGTVKLNDRFQNGTSEMGVAISKWSMATGQGADFARAWDEQYQDSLKMNSENRTKALQQAGELAGATGGLQGELMGVEIQAQALKIAIQTELTPRIVDFGKVANEVLAGVRKAVAKVTGKEETGGSFMPSTGQLIGGGMVLAGGLMSMTGIGATIGVPLAQAGLLTAGAATVDKAMGGGGGMAAGGISTGPISGYSQTLHGTEAVVPLPDNRNIPVSLDSSSLTAAVNQNSSILNAILEEMKDSNSISSQIVQNTY
jgi:hypothetical protein